MQIFLSICVSSVYPMPRYRILIVSTCIVRLRKPFLMNRRTSFIYMCVCVCVYVARSVMYRGEEIFEGRIYSSYTSRSVFRDPPNFISIRFIRHFQFCRFVFVIQYHRASSKRIDNRVVSKDIMNYRCFW